MDQKNITQLILKIENLHTSLKKRIGSSHKSTFQKGNNLIEILKSEQKAGYNNGVKDSVVDYIDEVIAQLYHVEHNTRGPFREHFRENVVAADVDRFRQQNAYLKNWIDFAETSGIIKNTLLENIRDALVQLNELSDYAKARKRIDDGEFTKKANIAYKALYYLRGPLRTLAMRYHPI